MASRHLSPQSYPTSLEDAFCIKRAPVSRDRTLCLLRKSNSVSLRQFRNPLFPTTIPSASCISSKFLNTKDWYSKPGFDFLNPRFSLGSAQHSEDGSNPWSILLHSRPFAWSAVRQTGSLFLSWLRLRCATSIRVHSWFRLFLSPALSSAKGVSCCSILFFSEGPTSLVAASFFRNFLDPAFDLEAYLLKRVRLCLRRHRPVPP